MQVNDAFSVRSKLNRLPASLHLYCKGFTAVGNSICSTSPCQMMPRASDAHMISLISFPKAVTFDLFHHLTSPSEMELLNQPPHFHTVLFHFNKSIFLRGLSSSWLVPLCD